MPRERSAASLRDVSSSFSVEPTYYPSGTRTVITNERTLRTLRIKFWLIGMSVSSRHHASSGTLSNSQSSVKCLIENFHQRPTSPRLSCLAPSLLSLSYRAVTKNSRGREEYEVGVGYTLLNRTLSNQNMLYRNLLNRTLLNHTLLNRNLLNQFQESAKPHSAKPESAKTHLGIC